MGEVEGLFIKVWWSRMTTTVLFMSLMVNVFVSICVQLNSGKHKHSIQEFRATVCTFETKTLGFLSEEILASSSVDPTLSLSLKCFLYSSFSDILSGG